MPKRKWDGMIDRTKRSMRKRPMDPAIWSRMPQDIQHHLIKFLPFPTLCRFRSLSKAWNAAILQQPSRQQWYITLDSQISKLHISPDPISWKEFTLPGITLISRLSTCAEGLALAFVFTYYCQEHYLVLNPMQHGRQQLLPVPHRRYHQLMYSAIQSSKDRSRFVVVVVAATAPGCPVMFLYDSRATAWSPGVDFPVLDTAGGERFCCAMKYGSSNSMLLHDDDHLYFLTVSPGDVTRLRSFNVWEPEGSARTVATWTSLPLGFGRQPSFADACARSKHGFPGTDMALISCGGKVVLGMLEPSDSASRGLGFVYLDEERCCWRAMASLRLASVLPPKMIRGIGRVNMAAAGNKNSSKVTLFFDSSHWGCGGCVLDLASGGSWRGICGASHGLLPLHPSSFEKSMFK